MSQIHTKGPNKVQPTGQQIQMLQDTLLDAFTFESLRRMTRIHLDTDLESIVPIQGRTLTDMTYDLIRVYASRDGGLHELMAAVIEVVPSNKDVVATIYELSQIQFDILPMPNDLQAKVQAHNCSVAAGNIILGQAVIRSILVTGDHNRVFVGHYESLQDAYIRPREAFERVSRLPFIEREWLLAEVDSFLQSYDRGYLVLEANAGLGKTAFLAWLVQQRNYIHHFCELSPGIEGISAGLRNLASQLTVAYKLRPERVIPEAASRAHYLYELLTEAASQQDLNEKIVVVIDALDEAGTLDNQNTMGLPDSLPNGVYFIVSQRPNSATLNVKDSTTTARTYCRFSAENSNNKADMRRFLEAVAELPKVAQALQDSQYTFTHEQFITTLMNKCDGVWIYLYFVVQEMVQGRRLPLDLATLPEGMTQYYARYWQRWRNADEYQWDAHYLPLLATLAATQEPLSCEQLIEWSGAEMSARSLRRLLERKFRPFLTITEQGNQNRYRFYHSTLQEFFDGKLEQKNLSIEEIELIRELVNETNACHGRLAERYIQAWGGWMAGLAGLKDEHLRDMDNRYGLRHIATHLERSGRVSDLHRLLRVEWVHSNQIAHPPLRSDKHDIWKESHGDRRNESYQNVWYVVREAVGQIDGYLLDIHRAWRLATINLSEQEIAKPSAKIEDTTVDKQNNAIGLQCRYALIVTSLNSHANNVKPALLVELIEKKRWLPAQGLAYARQVPHMGHRARILISLVPFMLGTEQLSLFQEAISAANSVEESIEQAAALASLIPHLSQSEQKTVLRHALTSARNIYDTYHRADALTKLIPHLPPGEQQAIFQEAFQTTLKIEGYDQGHSLMTLTPYLSHDDIQIALSITSNLDNDSFKAKVNAHIVQRLVKLGKLQDATALARDISDDSCRAEALAKLAAHYPEDEQQVIRHEAITTARNIADTVSKANILGDIAIHFPEEEKQTILQEAFLSALDIKHDPSQVDLLVKLAPQLSAEQLTDLLLLVENSKDKFSNARVQAASASRLAELGQHQKALDLAHRISRDSYRAEALIKLLPYLAIEEQSWVLHEALKATRSINDGLSQADTLAKLAPYLSKREHKAILQKTFTASPNSHKNIAIIRQIDILTKLIPHLSRDEQQIALQTAIPTIFTFAIRGTKLSLLAHIVPCLLKPEIHQVSLSVIHLYPGYILFNLVNCLSLSKIGTILIIAGKAKVRLIVAIVYVCFDSYLSEEQLEVVVLEALSFKNGFSNAEVIALLASRLAELGEWQGALTLTRSIDNNHLRAVTLCSMVTYLPPDEQQPILQEALDAARKVIDAYDRADTLTKLIPFFLAEEQQRLIQEAFTDIITAEKNSRLANVITSLAHYLSVEQLKVTLALTFSKEHGSSEVKIRACLAPALAGLGELQEALSLTRQIKNDAYRAVALANLISHYPEKEQQVIRHEAITAARNIDDNLSRAKALVNLVPHLTKETQRFVLQESFFAACSIEDTAERAIAHKTIAPYLIELAPHSLYSLWSESLPILAGRTRYDLLSDFEALSDVLIQLGGVSTILETAKAIQDVGRWWS